MHRSDNALQNPDLWVSINSKGMPFKTEMELLILIIEQSSNQIKTTDILSIQRLATKDPMILVYCHNKITKTKLLSLVTLEVADREYEMTSVSAQKDRGFGSSSLRLSIHGIPFSVSDYELEDWVDTWAKRTSRVRKAKAKPKDDNTHTLLNGNRFCFISHVISPKPRYSYYTFPDPLNPENEIEVQITLYYDNQVVNCRKCQDLHDTRECPTAPQKPAQNTNADIETFRGSKHPLSNYFPVTITDGDVSYPSAEHFYQHTKAVTLGLHDEAAEILRANTPYRAMQLGDEINGYINAPLLADWESQKVDVMCRTLELKYDNSDTFREFLHETHDKMLVEATGNTFWASGLPPNKTLATPHALWPGLNHLGRLLMELRETKSVGSVTQYGAVQLVDELIAHALNSNNTNLSSPEVLQMTERIMNTPRCIEKDPTPPPRPKRKNVLSPLVNEPKRLEITPGTPRIDTIFQKSQSH